MPRLSQLFIERSIFWITEEYPSKIEQCLKVLPADALWARTDEGSNSIGNLLIHLTGNVTQWIIGGVAESPYSRNRPAEFAARNGGNAKELFATLRAAVREAAAVIEKLSPEDLEAKRFIQGRDTTVLGAVYHVVEHFAMHTGQIVLLTKIHAPGAIRFYDDSGPVARPLWKRGNDVTKPAD
jgi:uncharacterized damage-inducible protein DinB